MIESEVKPQGGGEKETTYNVQYIFVYKGNLVILQGMLFRYNLKADVTEKEKAHQREVHWLICTRIANSVTISKE